MSWAWVFLKTELARLTRHQSSLMRDVHVLDAGVMERSKRGLGTSQLARLKSSVASCKSIS